MKFADRELVDGTAVTIGRRVKLEKSDTGTTETTARVYTAEYKDAEGKRQFESLQTSDKREARRKAIQIQERLDEGRTRQRNHRLTIPELIDGYMAYNAAKGLARKSLAKYKAELDKLREFSAERKIFLAQRFDEEAFYAFHAWLQARKHKQGTTYCTKTLFTTMTVTKQAFKHYWRKGLLPEFKLMAARLPSRRARPQACFTLDELDLVLSRSEGIAHAAIATMGYAGLRVGECIELRWNEVRFDSGELGMIHVCRGGSSDAPKDKDNRFVPIHPKLKPILLALPRSSDRVFPSLKDRTLLAQLKRICKGLGLDERLKVHSLRHTFASMCANNLVSYRLALSWLGHSSSDILAMYYHLTDTESSAAMKLIAEKTMRQK